VSEDRGKEGLTEEFGQPDTERVRTPRFEILIAVLLGTAALLTAGSAYIGDRDDGQQLSNLQKAERTRAEAFDAYSNGDQEKALDQTIFMEYALASQQGDNDLAAYLIQFSPTLKDALEVWADTNEQTPFSGDKPAYFPAAYAEGEELQTKAGQEFERADFYDERGDKFVFATVLFAISLALFGVASVIWLRRWRLGLTGGGTAFLLAGATVVVVNLF